MTSAAQLRLPISDERARLTASAELAALIASKPLPFPLPLVPTVPAHRRSKFDPRAIRYFGGPRLPYQRAPDRERALRRRRRLAWRANAMPDNMRMQLTEAERAFANLVREHHERQGYFDLCHDVAAALMGCCAKTVQRAQHRLKELKWIEVDHRPRPGRQKHLPNIVKIVSREWLAWIARGPRPIESGHLCPATQSDKQTGNSFANSVPTPEKRYSDDASGVGSLQVKKEAKRLAGVGTASLMPRSSSRGETEP